MALGSPAGRPGNQTAVSHMNRRGADRGRGKAKTNRPAWSRRVGATVRRVENRSERGGGRRHGRAVRGSRLALSRFRTRRESSFRRTDGGPCYPHVAYTVPNGIRPERRHSRCEARADRGVADVGWPDLVVLD